ncbi:hypothetical protein F4778DRAFT_765728 [Xylariomycetidae sp. FL2044]|nr:hypothetical protein F4778DRAFT_765728 [Xylariomycetidae sp. FL2044]
MSRRHYFLSPFHLPVLLLPDFVILCTVQEPSAYQFSRGSGPRPFLKCHTTICDNCDMRVPEIIHSTLDITKFQDALIKLQEPLYSDLVRSIDASNR